MAKKKKKMAHKGDTFVMENKPVVRKSVDIKKASNGFVVSSWSNDKEELYIAKDKSEADKYVSKLLTM